MTVAELIALINQEITANGNNEITGPILNDILVKMVNQINDKVGELSDLETSVTTDIVAAINSVLNSQNIGVVVHYGQDDPNVTPPSSYEIGDMYSKENVLNNTTDLFIYTGVPSVGWLNLTSIGGWVESVTGNIVDNTDPLNPVVTQVQSDWNENDSDEPSFIKNREVIIIAVIVGSTPPIATGDVEYEIPIKGNYDILDYSIYAQDAPVGGTTTIGLKKNGSSITTTGVNIASGSNDSTGTPTFSDNDVSNSKIRFTFTAIASYAGSKYTASIKLLKT